MRPRLLDLFCGAGGASMGYFRAGFEVVGVDLNPQPNYPFEFIESDALDYALIYGDAFDAIHASPPCQAYSWSARRWNKEWPDLVAPTRDLLDKIALPYVIENVVGAPLDDPVTLCGLSFDITGAGLHNGTHPEVLRHRRFESNWTIEVPAHVKHIPNGVKQGLYVTVAGHGGDNARGFGGRVQKQRAMGIDWMTDEELNEAIPPAYAKWVGQQLIARVAREEVAA